MRHTIIIAEAGVNHNGSFEIAKKLIDAAEIAGADYVKFQTFKADKLVSLDAPKAAYQIKNMTDTQGQNQFDMLRKLELSDNEFISLNKYAKEKNIGFLSTPFDLESIDFLVQFNMDYFKVGSGDVTNKPLLIKIGRLKMPVILSTGMSYMKEVKDAVDTLLESGLELDKITILQCNTEYPTPPEDVNLSAMISISNEFGVSYGYSDHAIGPQYAVAAVAMGATIIEKHITLDQEMEGPDHAASASPDQFSEMVKMIRNIEDALGSGIKEPSGSEKKNLEIARKSIHLKRNVAKGVSIVEEDIIMKRPGNGISPMEINEVLGRKTNENLPADYLLQMKDLD